MATQRYISTSFWDDAWIRSLKPIEKFIYMYLMTNTLTNIAGVYEITIDRICFDTGCDKKTVESALNNFKVSKKAYMFRNYIVLPTWPKHQKWTQRSKIRDGIISELQDIPKKVLIFANEVGYEFDLQLVDTTIIARKERVGISGSTRKKMIDSVNGECQECGSNENVEIHHKIPIKEGGTNSVENLIPLCVNCHRLKHSPHTIYGQSNQSKIVHNYSEFDSDSDSDIDIDINSSSPASADAQDKSLLPPAKKQTHKLSPMKNETAQLYQDLLTEHVPAEAWKSIPQERAQLNKLAKNTARMLDTTPFDTERELAEAVLGTYLDMKRTSRNRYIRDGPLTPSGLITRWDQVIETMRNNWVAEEEMIF